MRHSSVRQYNLSILSVDVPTRTGLVYGLDAVNEIVKQANAMCLAGQLLGWPAWVGPQDDKERMLWIADHDNASHLVRSVWIVDHKDKPSRLHASIEPLRTANGVILETDLQSGEIGLGIRARGKLEPGSTIVIPSCLSLVAIDALAGAN